MKVIVGKEKIEYGTHKPVLTNSTFFATCLGSGIRETVENNVGLPEDDPAASEAVFEVKPWPRASVDLPGRLAVDVAHLSRRPRRRSARHNKPPLPDVTGQYWKALPETALFACSLSIKSSSA
jgi:hypothetical protein